MNECRDKIEILSPALLDRFPETVREVKRLSRVLGMEFGWHYILDIAWILEELDLPRGAVILDAGAGAGLLQFALAQRGYNVLSVDYSDRKRNPLAALMFRIEDTGGPEFEHEYIEHLEALGTKKEGAGRYLKTLLNLKPLHALMPFLYLGRLIGVRRPGTVTYCRADMCRMDAVADGTVDAVVSVSAIEHIDKEKIGMAVKEFKRVLKPGGMMAVTTSAARDDDWFHEPSRGWCFTERTLRDFFDLHSSDASNYDHYDEFLEQLHNCERLRKGLASFYFDSDNNGMPRGVWDPKYQPVGILMTNPIG